MKLRQSVALGFALSVGASASAHHSTSMYDLRTTRMIEGVVTDYEWANPHVYISVVADADHAVWQIEAFPPSGMRRLGWSPKSLALGDHVVVLVHPGRRAGRMIALGQSLTTSDGVTRQLSGPLSAKELEGRAAASSIAGD